MKDLFVEHPYYCTEGNYYKNGHHHTVDSWALFERLWAGEDEDMNLLFRWDMERSENGPVLRCFYMQQRKARCCSVEVTLTYDDLPKVQAWLEGKWRHIQRLWAPLSGVDAEP